MNCKNCGMQNTLGEKFCKNCGCLLQSDEITNNIPTPNANVDKIVMPNMKKYAIFSIIIGAGGIICAIFIGMSLLISVFLSALGFSFATKGLKANKTLAIIGYVLNGILLAIGIIIYFLLLFEVVEPM